MRKIVLSGLLLCLVCGCGKDNPAGGLSKPPQVRVYNLLPEPLTSVSVGSAKWSSIGSYTISTYQNTDEGYPMMKCTYQGIALGISLRDASRYPFEVRNQYEITVRYNYYYDYAYIDISHQGTY